MEKINDCIFKVVNFNVVSMMSFLNTIQDGLEFMHKYFKVV